MIDKRKPFFNLATRYISWRLREQLFLGRPVYVELPTMYEDELPSKMSKINYELWYANSAVIDGVRMGPKLFT